MSEVIKAPPAKGHWPLEPTTLGRRSLACLVLLCALTVPAHAALWSHTDETAGHYRRYSEEGLRRVLVAAGFRVCALSPFMGPLYPLMWAGRRAAAVRNRWRGPVRLTAGQLTLGELRVVPVVNTLLEWVLRLEAPLLARGWRLPAGTSLLAVAEWAGPGGGV